MSTRGFTLIEVLVVVTIIGLLATVVLSGMRQARLNAADSRVKQEIVQLRTVMELERAETGSYAAIKSYSGPSFIAAGGSCSGFTGTYASQAQSVCQALVSATGNSCGSACVYFRSTNPSSPTLFTIMAYLPGSNTYYCLGSSGKYSATTPYPSSGWNEPGCYNNP